MTEDEIRRDERKRMGATNSNFHRRLQLLESFWLRKLVRCRDTVSYYRDAKAPSDALLISRREGFDAAIDLMLAQYGDYWWNRQRLEQIRITPDWDVVSAPLTSHPTTFPPSTTGPANTREKP